MLRLLSTSSMIRLALSRVLAVAFAAATLGLCPCPEAAAEELVEEAHACCTEAPTPDDGDDCPVEDCPHCGEAPEEPLAIAAPPAPAAADASPSFPLPVVADDADRDAFGLMSASVRGSGPSGGPPELPPATLRAQRTLLRV